MPEGLNEVKEITGGDDYYTGHYAIALKKDGTLVSWGSEKNPARSEMPANLPPVKAIAGGSNFAVALLADGTLRAWGANWSGQTSVPAGLTGVQAVSAGHSHALALAADGTVRAWGGNWNGQANVPAGLSNVIAIAAGGSQSVALKANGSVIGWGQHNDNSLPNGVAFLSGVIWTSGIKAIAAGDNHIVGLRTDGTISIKGTNWGNPINHPQMTGLAGVIKIAAGAAQTLVLKSDGSVVGFWESSSMEDWPAVGSVHMAHDHIFGVTNDGYALAGWPNGGQHNSRRSVPAGALVVAGPTHSQTIDSAGELFSHGKIWDASDGLDAVQMALGEFFTIALLRNGRVSAWGADWAGQTDVPPGLSDVTAVAAGEQHALALKADGTVVGWGANLNTGNKLQVPDDLKQPSTAKVKLIAAGGWFCAALRENGELRVWGGNVWQDPPLQTVSNAGSDILQLAAGSDHVLALKQNGTVVAWGQNGAGQCSVPEGLSGVVAIAAGGKHSLALKSDGTVIAWGDDSTVPQGLAGVTAISSSKYHSAAIVGTPELRQAEVAGLDPDNAPTIPGEGSIVVWGSSQLTTTPVPLRDLAFGGYEDGFAVGVTQAGRVLLVGGNIDDRPLAPPENLGEVKRVAAGDSHIVALLADGSVAAWGSNGDGQCDVPADLGQCAAVTAGLNFSAALRKNGTIAVWGSPLSGVLNLPPAATTGITAISAAAVGQHILALRSDGTVVAWGRNPDGQCNVPLGLANVVAISAGGQGIEGFSLALRRDGTVVAWGNNTEGQSTVPVGLSGVVEISAGDDYAMARRADGTFVRWANPAPQPSASQRVARVIAGNDQAAVLSSANIFVPVGQPPPYAVGPANLAGFLQVSAGHEGNALALRKGGAVAEWGQIHDAPAPTSLSGVKLVSSGDDYSLALKNDGSVVYWGGGDEAVASVPASVRDISTLSAGNDFALAVKRGTGEVIQWGSGIPASPPAGLSNVLQVVGGDRHALALKADGTVVAWGQNGFGESTVPAGLSGVVQIAAAAGFSLALKNDGTVVGWGNPFYATIPTELAVPATARVKQISARKRHILALRDDGTVVAWGRPGASELRVPPGLRNVTAISAGSDMSIALVGDAARDPQTINFTQPAAQAYGPNKTFALRATASSKLPVTFESADTNILIISNSVATIRTAAPAPAGVKVIARQAGNASYAPAPDVTNTVIIHKANQTITFAQPAVQTFAPDKTFVLRAVASSKMPVSFQSLNTNVARITNDVVTIVGAGQVPLIALQAGDSNYNEAPPVQRVLSVTKMNIGSSVTLSGTNHVYAPGTNWGVAVSTVSPNLATVVTYGGSTNRPTNAGSHRFVATITDPNYQGVVRGTMVVAKSPQTITFNTLGVQKMRAGTNVIVLSNSMASASSGLPLSFVSSHPSVATVSSNRLIIKWPASVTNLTITARQAGNVNYLAAAPSTSALALAAWPIYVDANATNGAADGSSWLNAFTNLQSALDLAKSSDEIWVARGTYKPPAINPLDALHGNTNDPRAVTFFLKNSVHLYGGFKGGEASKDDRDAESNPTILSGDFGENDVWPMTESGKSSLYDNAYHVVYAYKLATRTIFDGFVVTGGYAGPNPSVLPANYDPGNDPHAFGGGLSCLGSTLWIENCVFQRNAALMGGGGLFAFSGKASIPVLAPAARRLDVRKSFFGENIVPDYRVVGEALTAFGGGGAFIADNFTARLEDVEFLSNSAPNGGAIIMDRGTPTSSAPSVTAYRCLFEDNRALCSPDEQDDPDGWVEDGLGGALRVTGGSSLAADSCAFVSNEASSNGFSTPQVNPSEGIRYGGNGGAASVDRGGKFKVSNSVFTANSADWAGGAVTVNTWSAGPISSLEIFYCTVYANKAKWGCGLNNYAATMTGYGNIIYRNEKPDGYFDDIGNTVQVGSVSRITNSLVTDSYSYNDNSGPVLFFGPLPDLFLNPAEPAGVNNEWGTDDDGFTLDPANSWANSQLRMVTKRPPDFADADGDGNVNELVPYDAKGYPFGSSGPYDAGAYQNP